MNQPFDWHAFWVTVAQCAGWGGALCGGFMLLAAEAFRSVKLWFTLFGVCVVFFILGFATMAGLGVK